MTENPALTKFQRNSSQGGSTESSYTYDHTGQDVAHKHADEQANLEAQRSAALMGDPLSVMPISKRISHLQNYLRAYNTGENPFDVPVLPGRRVASERHSASSNNSSSAGVEFGWPTPASTSSG
jgi:hypothetical protein